MKPRIIAALGFTLAAIGCGSDAAPPTESQTTIESSGSLPMPGPVQIATPPYAAIPPREPSVAANVFVLAGTGVEVAYAPSVEASRSVLTYLDRRGWRTFRGEEIASIDTPAGTLVSVALDAATQPRSTTFSLLLPRARVEAHATGTPVTTLAITARHELDPGYARGQLDAYAFSPLTGSARHVDATVARAPSDVIPLPTSVMGLLPATSPPTELATIVQPAILPRSGVAANVLQLSGGGVQIEYAPAADPANAVFVYRNGGDSRTFRGGEIATLVTPAGVFVTVALRRTVDRGSTTLTLVAPRVAVSAGASETVGTMAITATHVLPVHDMALAGQLDVYGFTALEGTARYVDDISPRDRLPLPFDLMEQLQTTW